MRQAMMNGPTLSPQGQIPPAYGPGPTNQDQAAQPPPGLRDLSGRPATSNGYTRPVGQRNGYHLESTSITLNAAPSAPNGINQGSEESSTAGWSARYTSFDTAEPAERPPQYSSATTQNPFLNSFERQRPTSSHATYNVPSPTKNPSPLSPPSQTGDNAVHSQVPQVNGTPAHRLSPVTPQLPSYSPIKQQASPPMPAIQHSPSSPNNHPRLHQNAPSSPGFSPIKHSPPRSFGPSEVTSTPVLPPVENLSPSPQVHNPLPPVKLANGEAA